MNASSVMRISSLPRIAIQKAGSLIGRRRTLNFVEGSNVTLTVQDNAGSNRVDCTIASSGGGSAALTQLIPYQSGSYYRSQYWIFTPTSFAAFGSGLGPRVAAFPLQVPTSVSVDRLRIYVQTAAAGKNAVIAIHDSAADGTPTTALVSAEVGLGSTGEVSAVVSGTVTAGLKWFTLHTETLSGLQLRGYTGGFAAVVGSIGMGSQNCGGIFFSSGVTYTGSAIDLTGLTPSVQEAIALMEFRSL